LSLAGIRPPSDAAVSVNLELRAGWIIDLSGDRPAPTKWSTNEAGQVIDARPAE